MMLRRVAVVCMCAGALACGPDSGTGDGDGDSGSSSGTAVDESSSGAPSDGPMCLVPDGHLMLTFQVHGDASDLDCTVVGIAPLAAGELEIQLDCGNPMSLRYTTLPAIVPALAVGDAVEVSTAHEESNLEGQEVRDSMFIREPTGALLVAAVSSWREDWTAELAPLQMQRIEGACADMPGEFDCTTGTRAMWEASVDGASEIVGDANWRSVGPYAVYIVRADASDLLECLDIEARDYRALIVRTQ